MRTFYTIALLAFALSSTVFGQKKEYDLVRLFQAGEMTVFNRHATIGENGKALKLDENRSQGMAWLKGVTFSTGTIEIDLKGRDVLQGSFVGVAFHGVNDSTFDAIYFRPFNFRSADPVRKIHAVQYVSHPEYTWKILRDTRNGIYEKGLLSPPEANAWFHARIVVKDKSIEVYVNDDRAPSLTVEKLNDRNDGKVALWVGDGADGEFRNFVITPAR